MVHISHTINFSRNFMSRYLKKEKKMVCIIKFIPPIIYFEINNKFNVFPKTLNNNNKF